MKWKMANPLVWVMPEGLEGEAAEQWYSKIPPGAIYANPATNKMHQKQ